MLPRKDKRRKRVIPLKQKQKQSQSQRVVINLGDLMKQRRRRRRPLVEPKPKQPHEMILTRVIHVPPPTPYLHTPPPPVINTTKGLEQKKYIPETYKNPNINMLERIEKLNEQPLPFFGEKTITESDSPEKPIGEKDMDDFIEKQKVPEQSNENPLIKRGKATKEQMAMRDFREENLIRQSVKLGTPSPTKKQIQEHLKKIEFEERLENRLKRN